jgi:ribosome biogenesis GTPase
MNRDLQEKLNRRLSLLTSGERRNLYKRAATLRKSSQRKKNPRKVGRSRISAENDALVSGGLEKRPRRIGQSLDEWVLQLIEWEEVESGHGGEEEATGLVEGMVTWIGAGVCRVERNGEEISCTVGEELARSQRTDLAIGDRVRILQLEDGSERVKDVLPRRTVLSRADPLNGRLERVLAANVEIVVIVASVQSPPLRPGLLDRFLIAIRRGGPRPVICVNKVDLLSESGWQEAESLVAPYRELEIPVHLCSARCRVGVEPLLAELGESLCVFVGHSGVGKSSLLNAIDPELGLAEGEVSESLGKGRHTTSASNLYRLSTGARIIDTPGIRELGIQHLGGEEVRDSFPELQELGLSCRFSDCTHTHEPGCAVKTAVEREEVSSRRYESYLKLIKP